MNLCVTLTGKGYFSLYCLLTFTEKHLHKKN